MLDIAGWIEAKRHRWPFRSPVTCHWWRTTDECHKTSTCMYSCNRM